MSDPRPGALVIGAGPAGLMAAETIAAAGFPVTLAEAKPSPARKFLMAGKSGLNLTKAEPLADFLAHYTPAEALRPYLETFGPPQVMAWARGLGQEVFAGTSRRVFPTAMKASPLLRAWMQRLGGYGVQLRRQWRWTGFAEGRALQFQTPDGPRLERPAVCLLALGGASWQRLGSDGAWVPWLRARGVTVNDWQPSNIGLRVSWSAHMAPHFGQPIKGAMLQVGRQRDRGEFVISARGLEGGGIYAIGAALRQRAPLTLDLFPDLSPDALAARWSRLKPGDSLSNRLRKIGLSPAASALAREFAGPAAGPAQLKSLPLRHEGPRPLDEAISTAGGIAWSSLTQGLELRAIPRLLAAGEMLDWDAPTGGYLLTACLATGRAAGQTAIAILQHQETPAP